MCDPMTIAGIALSAGSTVANTIASRKAANARDDVLAAERIRQRGYDSEADALNETARDRFEDTDVQQEAKATSLGDYFATAEPTAANAAAASVMPTSTNDVVTREMRKKSGEAKAYTDQQAGALGQLRAFGDVLADNSRLQARDAGAVGQISGFKRGSSDVIPLELDRASQAGSGLRVLGDILGGFGGMAVNAGLTGGGSGLFGGSARAPAASPRPVARPASLYPQQSGAY